MVYDIEYMVYGSWRSPKTKGPFGSPYNGPIISNKKCLVVGKGIHFLETFISY